MFGDLVAFPITPADEDGHVDTETLGGLLQRLVDAAVPAVGVLGSTGSYPYLSRAERFRVTETAARRLNGKARLLVGIGALRTDDAIRFGEDAANAGADAVLLAPMSYLPLTEEEVFVHFEAVALAVGLPLCIYNNPGATHFTIGTGLLGRLARIPNVTAVKQPAPSADTVQGHLRACRAATPPGFSIGYSVDMHATDAMLAGGDAWYSVVGGLFPSVCLDILRTAQASDPAEARLLDARLLPLWQLFTEFSSFRVMYAAASLLDAGLPGLRAAAPPRPILPLGQDARRRVAAVLGELGLLA